MKLVSLLVCTVMPLTLTPSAVGAFTFATHAFGDSGGQPYRTSDGSGFFVHSSRDAGDGTPDLSRPLHSASWAGAGNDLEWTSYFTHDGLGPSRRSGAPNNASDQFYITAGVYPAGFSSRNSNFAAFTPGHDAAARAAVVDTGVIFGGTFIAGPSQPSGPSPLTAMADLTFWQGLFLARLTVRDGVTISGSVTVVGSFGTSQLVLNSGIEAGGVVLNSYKVADIVLTDSGFDTGTGESENFAGVAVDVYDIWLEQPPFPSPGPVAVFGAAGLVGLRRRRA